MGGAAFLIEGSVSPALLEDRPLPRSLLDRVLCRTRRQGVTRTTWGETTLIEIPVPPALRGLWPCFKEWLGATLPGDDPAARAVLGEYVQVDVCDVFLRGSARDRETRYYLQLGFSGCAGLGDVSAQLLAHWAEVWWGRDRGGVEAVCTPVGFAPTGPWDDPGAALFFPLKQGGYALYTDAQSLPSVPGLPPDEGLPWLEVDGALCERRADVDERLAELKPVAQALFTERRCRCALCTPDFRRQDGCAL